MHVGKVKLAAPSQALVPMLPSADAPDTTRALRGRAGCRWYNFASSQYYAFDRLVYRYLMPALRASAVELDSFDPQRWYDDPMSTILNGELRGGHATVTVDAFGRENGAAEMATPSQVDAVIAHVRGEPPRADLRREVRALEAELFSDHTGFYRQLPSTSAGRCDEIEESLEANEVERRLGDATGRRGGRNDHSACTGVRGLCVLQLWTCRARRCATWSLACPLLCYRGPIPRSIYRWCELLVDAYRATPLTGS